jgi:hypothetical protein
MTSPAASRRLGPTEVTPNCFIVHRSQKADFLPPLGY